MNESFNKLLADKVLQLIILSSVGTTCIAVVLLFIFYSKLPPFLPIYNQQPWGETQLGRKEDIFFPITITIGVCIANALFASRVYTKMPLVARMLCVTSLFVSFFTLLFVIRTLLTVT